MAERVHIALVGFMGSGKSTVGKALAEKIGYVFVDLDEAIAQQTGLSIPKIFKEHGEVGFRARERAALRRVLDSASPTVLATGGGTFVDDAMRQMVQRSARTIYLKADPEVLFDRIGSGSQRAQRPMLAGPDPRSTVRRLLERRTPAYEQSEFTLETDDSDLQTVVDEITDVLRVGDARKGVRRRGDGPQSARPSGSAPVIEVHSGQGNYPVMLKDEVGSWLAGEIDRVVPGSRLAVITDSTVKELHADRLVADLKKTGKSISLHVVKPGEGSKSLSTAESLYGALLQEGITRQDGAVALGGGVIGDLTGFVASTVLRGIQFVQVPTTTLSAVDASVGGKTAVNTPLGKNLVGTFYPPRGVFIATGHLATQDRRRHAEGMVEALKMAATLDAQLFEDILQQAAELLDFDTRGLLPILSRAIQLKAAVVSRDEKEAGERAVLNYGHTIGHAIERGAGFRLLHGEAVAVGMVAEAEWAQEQGLPAEVTHRLVEGLRALGQRIDWRQFPIDMTALGLDKKREGNAVRLPVVPRLGSYELRSVPVRSVIDFVQRSIP